MRVIINVLVELLLGSMRSSNTYTTMVTQTFMFDK